MGLSADLKAVISAHNLFPPMTWDAHADVLRRAQLVLGDRTEEAIDAISAYCAKLLAEHLDDIEEVTTEVWSAEGDLAPTRFSGVRALYIARDLVPLAPPQEIADITWADLFATMALRQFTNFLERLQRQYDTPERERQSVPVQILIPYGDAVEAISLAEILATDATHDSLIKAALKARFVQKQREQTQAASANRHTATTQLLRDLVAFFDNGDFDSYRQATAEFLEQTPAERFKHLAPTNRLRTLAEGLSAVKRGKRTLD